MHFTWTPNMDATLKAMRHMGCSWRQVAETLAVTPDAARHRLLRIKSGVLSKEQYLDRLTRRAWTKTTEQDAPHHCPNDCEKHLWLVSEASPRGFPVLNVAPYRRAA